MDATGPALFVGIMLAVGVGTVVFAMLTAPPLGGAPPDEPQWDAIASAAREDFSRRIMDFRHEGSTVVPRFSPAQLERTRAAMLRHAEIERVQMEAQRRIEAARLTRRINEHPQYQQTGEFHRLVAFDATGRLYHVSREAERAPYRAYVSVVNPTPNGSGALDEHFISVPPDMKTAKQAVAWTYGLSEDEYDPAIRT